MSTNNRKTSIEITTNGRPFNVEGVFIDLDGTLIDKFTKRISKKNIDAIREKQKYMPFVISTGRSYSKKVKKIMNILDIDYAICQNGAVIVDKNGTILKNITLNKEQVSKIINIVKENKLGFTINSEFLIYSNYWLLAPIRFLWRKKWKLIKKYNFKENTVNKIVIAGFLSTKKIWNLTEKMSNSISGLSIKTSGRDKIIEITSEDATKGLGSKFISEILKINSNNTIHIGDSENDTTTLDIVGALIAMKNGSKKLLDVATHVGPGHKRSGVAKVLNGQFKEIK